MKDGRDFWYHEELRGISAECPAEKMNAEDPLFILYTSGSTGQPKGVLHTTGGYLLYVSVTHEYVFDYHDGDIYWCTADVGWVTGHSYIVYGPLANGAIDDDIRGRSELSRRVAFLGGHRQAQGQYILYRADRHSRVDGGRRAVRQTLVRGLRCACSAAWASRSIPKPGNGIIDVVGDSRCPIVDTWWQTETGGIMITPLPGATKLKPGSATPRSSAFMPATRRRNRKTARWAGQRQPCHLESWPGQMRTVYGDHNRFVQTYFSAYRGMYFTGDGCRRDEDGYYWITGRVDDVINVSGHRLGTAEVESALVAHPKVSEAAVVGYPHDIKGQGIYCYVTLMAGEPAMRNCASN